MSALVMTAMYLLMAYGLLLGAVHGGVHVIDYAW